MAVHTIEIVSGIGVLVNGGLGCYGPSGPSVEYTVPDPRICPSNSVTCWETWRRKLLPGARVVYANEPLLGTEGVLFLGLFPMGWTGEADSVRRQGFELSDLWPFLSFCNACTIPLLVGLSSRRLSPKSMTCFKSCAWGRVSQQRPEQKPSFTPERELGYGQWLSAWRHPALSCLNTQQFSIYNTLSNNHARVFVTISNDQFSYVRLSECI